MQQWTTNAEEEKKSKRKWEEASSFSFVDVDILRFKVFDSRGVGESNWKIPRRHGLLIFFQHIRLFFSLFTLNWIAMLFATSRLQDNFYYENEKRNMRSPLRYYLISISVKVTAARTAVINTSQVLKILKLLSCHPIRTSNYCNNRTFIFHKRHVNIGVAQLSRKSTRG